MNDTRRAYLGMKDTIDLYRFLQVPGSFKKGLFKCRVIYDKTIRSIEFLPYQIQNIKSLRIVDGTMISYDYKFLKRERINQCFNERRECDDVLIIKDGYITDTSYCNIVFLKDRTWITPSTYLLNGIQRQNGLDRGIIKEEKVKLQDICAFSHFKLINAMRPFSKVKKQPIRQIKI